MTTRDKTYTADDLWTLSHAPQYANKRLELIDGELYEMTPAGGEHGEITMELGARVRNHVRERRLGRVTAAETGYKLSEITTLAPDIGFIAADRAPERLPKGYIPLAPDLAVEVVSPSDRAADVQHKVQMYLQFGVKLVWVVYPDTRSVMVHTGQGAITLTADDTLDGGDVLPGFTLAVKAIFGEE